MSKLTKRARKGKITNSKNPLHYYALQAWQYQLDNDLAVITAYVEASGKYETVLTVHPTSGANAETLATYICNLINQHHGREDILQEAMSALELVLNDGLTFSSEQAAEHAVNQLRRMKL